MRRKATWVTVALIGLTAAAAWTYARPEAAAALTAEDRQEIIQLYATLYQGSDFRDAELWLSTFADDAVFVFPTGDRIAGREALAAWRENSFGGETGDSRRRHYVPNVRLTPAPDGGAAARVYWIEMDVAATPARIRNTGTADDVFVKTADGWKFKSRAVHLDAVLE